MFGKGASGPSSTIRCLPTLPQRGMHGGVVRVGGEAMHQVARAVFVDPVLRVVEPIRIRHRVEVIEVAEEFVEAVHGRQVFVQIAEMILAELSGGVAERFEHGGGRDRLVGDADIGAGLADRRHAGAQRNLPGDEVGASGGAACLRVVVGKAHAFGGELVEVRRLARHDALVIGADIEPADIVTHDDEDVWRPARCCRLLRLRELNGRGRSECRSGRKRGAAEQYAAAIEGVSF